MDDRVAAPKDDVARLLAAPDISHRRRQFFRRLFPYSFALAAIIAGVWFGYDWWTYGRFFESTDDAYVGGNITMIAPHVGGFIDKIAITDNQHVKAGQLLIDLDNRDYRAAEEHAEAVFEQRQAALNSLRAEYALQQSKILKASADLGAKKAQAIFAKADAARYRHLASSDAGTTQDAQRTQTLEEEAHAAVTAAEADLDAAKQELAVLDANIREAGAAVLQSEADVKTARLNLGYTEIRSPIDGYVGNRAAQVGSYVSQGSYLLTIIPTHGLWVDANFKEDQLTHMSSGQQATIIADVQPGHVFDGHVESLAPGTGAVFSVIPPENATGNFTKIVQRVPVRIAFDPQDGLLGLIRPGLSATVKVDTRKDAAP